MYRKTTHGRISVRARSSRLRYDLEGPWRRRESAAVKGWIHTGFRALEREMSPLSSSGKIGLDVQQQLRDDCASSGP